MAQPALMSSHWEHPASPRQQHAELTAALMAPQAFIAPKYFYDALGSKLFEAICALPEYYPTRTEAAIFAAHQEAIAAAVGQGCTLIDLGAGNCAKAASLFEVLQPRQYVPVDISGDFLQQSVQGLQHRFAQLPMQPLAMDFSTTLDLPDTVPAEQRLFFYPGSSLGNFDARQALAFLRRLRAALPAGSNDGGVLIGLDLVKEVAVLEAAYDDALGVTAAFNLNVLHHVNDLLGTDFDPRHWRHVAFYNIHQQRIEMYLEARRDLIVRWPGGRRTFHQGERIHTEYSHKFTEQDILSLLEQAGFGACRMWFDERRWFTVCHARAR
ncbi:L-histidine N(alpha)-methyltransferase [Herbaspirillum rubrisubalbicans]|uniref:L-histidine N(alpha)-methyltransferase n=1 Tax=Herbaspirillum rubrisubalbicans TaxID=80842 RepID=UPI0002F4982E|nr:L-histidine N(alpha)-methyltransferase [Herbaspirillum rubrisubalbicans]